MRHTFDDRSWGRSMAALADGDEAGAYAVLASAWNACVQGKREFCGHYLLPSLVALGVAQGHEAEASQAVAVLNRYLNDRPGPAMHRSAAFAAALIDSDAGQLLQVADDYAAAGRPLFEAEAREHAAELLSPPACISTPRCDAMQQSTRIGTQHVRAAGYAATESGAGLTVSAAGPRPAGPR